MAVEFWSVPPLWSGPTALLGGGPSLTQAQVDACRGRARVIAINNAYLLAPWADLLYACDARWWGWHKDRPELDAFAGLKVGLHDPDKPAPPGVLVLRRGPNLGLAEQRDTLALGANGGHQALNLAVHLGGDPIILLGFDMRAVAGRTNWHTDHPEKTPPRRYDQQMIPAMASLVEPLTRRGVRVINATEGSALRCFPMMSLERTLDDRAAAA